MIFVMVGTNEAPFDRLVRACDEIAHRTTVIVQCGASHVRPAGATCLDYIPFGEVVGLIRTADTVVTHAGVGSIMTALAEGKRPVVVPRRQAYREAVDDHQLEVATRFSEAGLVDLVLDPADLEAVIESRDAGVVSLPVGDSAIAEEIHDYLVAQIAP